MRTPRKRITKTGQDSKDQSIFAMESIFDKDYRFAPRASLDGKFNYCRHVFVDESGVPEEIVRLNVFNDRHREEIVAFHFCQQYSELIYGESAEQPQFYIVGRDQPWDFSYVMHDASRFNLEICRVANVALLKALKAENDCSLLLQRKTLQGYEVLKIERHFPGTIPDEIVAAARITGGKRRLFDIGKGSEERRVFLRPPMNPRIDLKLAIFEALSKKAAKKNSEKEETSLVLDNLTTHSSPNDFFEAFEALSTEIELSPFLSIWLYTGYYSDDRGYDCEFTLMPISVSEDMHEKLVANKAFGIP